MDRDRTSLYSLLLCAGVAVLLPALNLFWVSPHFRDQIIHNTEAASVRLANHMTPICR